MRIGVDATPLSVPRAGVGTYTANLVRALLESGNDEVVPFLHRVVHPSFAEDLEGLVCRTPPGRSRVNKTLWMQTGLRRRIRRGGFDICHFTNGVAPLGCSAPYVVTIHDAGLWLHPEYHYSRRLWSMRPLIPRVARGADAVITVSRTVKEEIVEVLGISESRIRVIRQGVSRHFARAPSAEELLRVREAYGLADRFVLSVGTLEPRKNLVRLIEAYTALIAAPAGRGVGLVIVGAEGWKSGPLEAALSRLPPDVPISLLGAVPDSTLVCLYHLATVLAFPSLYEGFGLPVVEAMACGTPVVTSKVGALAEVAGDAAELVEPERVESIADGLSRVLSDGDRARELRHRGLERAPRFSWTRAARETRDLYSEITGVSRSYGSEATRAGPTIGGRPTVGGAPTPEEAILRTVAYADVFDFPLTAGEIHRYLVGARATPSEVREALDHDRTVRRHLVAKNGFHALRGREEIVELRRARAKASEDLWADAIRFGKVLADVPFVRMVAVTGSLAARNIVPGADIDYLVVTEPGRLWLCRALVILVVRRAARRGVALCPNYFLSESALALEERDLYTAWELAQAVPIAGWDTYERLRDANRWAEEFLPNAGDAPRRPAPKGSEPGRRSLLARTAEVVLRSPVGSGLERWERNRKIRRFTAPSPGGGSEARESMDADFDADRCKGHFGTQAWQVLERYRARVDALGR